MTSRCKIKVRLLFVVLFFLALLTSQNAHAQAGQPTVTLSAPTGNLVVGQPIAFTCTAMGEGVTGSIAYLLISGEPEETSGMSGTTDSVHATFTTSSLIAGSYTAKCQVGLSDSSSVSFTIQLAQSTGVQGFVNPKYVVVGITYAPPGPSSYVQYTGTTSVGSTTAISSSFSSKYGFSVSVKSSAGIEGFGPSGSVTAAASTDYTQGSNSSTTTTISKLSSLSYKTDGTGNAFSPVDSDYDIIWLWLNPVVLLTYTPATGSTVAGMQWNGFGYDTNDPSGTDQPDVYPVLVGYLNGDFGANPSMDTVLSRAWAGTSNYTWATGTGPSLTGVGSASAGTDVAQIIAQDPLASSSYTLLSNHPSTTSDGRFTLVTLPNNPNPIPYVIAGPDNGAGLTTMYSVDQTNTQADAQGTSSITTQEFSTEEVFGGSVWLGGLTLTLQQSDTLTWTNSWLNTLTTTTTLDQALSITGPPCPNPAPCQEYSGPGQFLVYQDNRYGTFAFYPSN
jgi:hypothetical protein